MTNFLCEYREVPRVPRFVNPALTLLLNFEHPVNMEINHK